MEVSTNGVKHEQDALIPIINTRQSPRFSLDTARLMNNHFICNIDEGY